MFTFYYDFVRDLHYSNQNMRLRHVLSVINETHVHIILCTHITNPLTNYCSIYNDLFYLLMYKSTINIHWVWFHVSEGHLGEGNILNSREIIYVLFTLLNQCQTTNKHMTMKNVACTTYIRSYNYIPISIKNAVYTIYYSKPIEEILLPTVLYIVKYIYCKMA